MARKKIIKRTYSGLVFDTPEKTSTLEKTFDFYNKGASFMLGEWLKLMGGFSKEFTPDHLKDQASVFCLTFWFTPVLGNKPVEYSVDPKELRTRFFRYWGDDVNSVSPEVLRVLETAQEGLKDDVVWVDRREQFLSSGLTSEDVALLFRDPKFILWGKSKGDDDEEENSNEYIRSMVSRYWKNGKKADYSEVGVFLPQFKSKIAVGKKLQDLLPIENYTSQVQTWAKQNEKQNKDREGTHPVVKHLRSKLGSKPGRASSVMLRVAKYYETTLTQESYESICKAIDEEVEESVYREDYKDVPCFTAIKPKLLATLGVTDLNVDQFCDILAMVIPSYRSWRSNFIRQMGLRQERYMTYVDLASRKVDSEVEAIIAESKKASDKDQKHPQKYLNTRQFRGVGKLLKWWESGHEDYLLPMKEDRFGWGDGELLRKLADVLHDRDDAGEVFDLLIDRERACADYYCMRHPYINLIEFQNPRFSSAKILFDELVDGLENVRYVELDLFKGNEFVKDKLKFAAARLFREVLYDKKVNEGRASRLMVSVHGKQITVNPEPVSLQLCRKKDGDKDRWYFNVSVTLPERSPIKEYAEKIKNNDGISILGIDLGWRNAIAFSHLKTSRTGDIKLVNEKKTGEVRTFSYEEGGVLDDAHLTRAYAKAVRKGEARFFSRLTEDYSIPTSQADMEIWNEMSQLVKWKYKMTTEGSWKYKQVKNLLAKGEAVETGTGEVVYRNEVIARYSIPSTWIAFAKSLAQCAKRIAYRLPLNEASGCVKKIHFHLSGRFRNNKDFTRRGFGGLTFSRMEFLTDIKSAYQTLNSRYEKDKLPRQEWIDQRVDMLNKRIKQIRGERVRIIVNLILRKAIEIGAPLVCVEDINRNVNQNQDSKANKKHSNWCAVRIAQTLEEAGRELGIVVKGVRPEGTSMEDIFAKDYRPRFNKYNVENESFGNAVERLNKKLKTTPGVRATVISRWCGVKKGDTKDLKSILISEANKDGQVLIPEFLGEYYPSSMFGWMNSDVHAAAVIALKGTRLLLGWFRAKDTDEKTESESPSDKSRRSKEVRAKMANMVRSQDVSTIPDMSWGFPDSSQNLVSVTRWKPSRDTEDKVYTSSGL